MRACALHCASYSECIGFLAKTDLTPYSNDLQNGQCLFLKEECTRQQPNIDAWRYYSMGSCAPAPTEVPTPSPTTSEICDEATTTFKACAAWGDPHYTASFFTPTHFNHFGVGLFKLASSNDNNFQVQAFQCPWGSSRASVYAGFAVKSGQSTITMINYHVKKDAVAVSASTNTLTVLSGGDEVSYKSPDKCVSFRSKNNVHSTSPGYYHNMNIEIAEHLASTDGVCGNPSAGRANINEADSLFSAAELDQLCTICGLQAHCLRRLSAGRRLPENEVQPESLEEVCQKSNITYSTATDKCQGLASDAGFFEGCIYDYCATGGDDSMVQNAGAEMLEFKARAQNRTLVSGPTGTDLVSFVPPMESLLSIPLLLINLYFVA
jgi:hypothetical protein